jgi:hypothetical protein
VAPLPSFLWENYKGLASEVSVEVIDGIFE